MATWSDASKFTWEELQQMRLTWDDLQKMSLDQLLQVAQLRLKQFSPQTPKEHKLKKMCCQTIEKIIVAVAADTICQIEWSDVIRGIIDLINEYM